MSSGSALILAGGKGSRMGRDKKFLVFDGEPLIDTLIKKLSLIFDEILVSSNTPFERDNVITFSDEFGKGPLAGIYAGLLRCASDWLYVIACDMPVLSPEYIAYLRGIVESTEQSSLSAVVAERSDGFLEPFNAFYHKRARDPIHDVLAREEYKPLPLLRSVPLHIVDTETAKRFGAERMFFNVNTYSDLNVEGKLVW